jgi:hypothetical protein
MSLDGRAERNRPRASELALAMGPPLPEPTLWTHPPPQMSNGKITVFDFAWDWKERAGWPEGERQGVRQGGRARGREAGRQGERQGGREAGREAGRQGGRARGREGEAPAEPEQPKLGRSLALPVCSIRLGGLKEVENCYHTLLGFVSLLASP